MNLRVEAEIFHVEQEFIIGADPDSDLFKGSGDDVKRILESLLVGHRP